MRLLLLFVLLGGCLQGAVDGPPLEDRGAFAEDIAAPAPTPGVYDDDLIEPEDPQEPTRLVGVVVDLEGRPVPGAVAWVETVDLRLPENNAAQYLAGKAATMVEAPNGTFEIVFEGAYEAVAASAPGFRIARSRADEPHLVLTPKAPPWVVAHRGASFYAPENTLPAMEKAALLGADFVEIDVRITRDGGLVAFHDHTLERASDGHGAVIAHDLAALRRLDVGAWFDPSFRGTTMPTLAEVLDHAALQGLRLMLDVKAQPEYFEMTREKVFDQVEEHPLEPILTFFRRASVEACHARGLECGWIVKDPKFVADLPATARHHGADVVLLDQALYDARLGREVVQAGIDLYVWTPNTEAQWRRLVDRPMTGIITDRPGTYLEFIAP